MKSVKTYLLSAAAVLAFATGASAATLIDNATQGLYNSDIGTSLDGTNPFGGNFMFPGANLANGDPSLDIPAANEPDLSAASGALGNWLTTPAAPGGTWSGPQAIPASWTVNTETAIIYEIDGGALGFDNVVAEFGVDNGIFVWLNGTFLGGHLRPGGSTLGEFALNIGSIGAGSNFLQVLREDHGGSTGFVVSVMGDVAAVPLPAAGLMLLGGLGALAGLRRRRRHG
jgi:hypothetical protein